MGLSVPDSARSRQATKTRIEDLTPTTENLPAELLELVQGGLSKGGGRPANKRVGSDVGSAGTTTSSGASDDD